MNQIITNDEVLNQHGEETGIIAPENFNTGMAFLNPAEMPDLDSAEVGFNIQPESIEFEKEGESLRAIFNGFTTFKVKDKQNKGSYIDKQTAVLQTKNGIKINMGANLLKQLALIPVGTAIQITYKGKTRTNGGNDVKVYEVVTLKVPQVNVPKIEHNTSAARPAASNAPRIWSFAQKQVLIEEGLADNDFAAKGMLGLSNLREDATEAEILAWGKTYRTRRNTLNEQGKPLYTAQQAAEYANAEGNPSPY
jgi:hypothetical protein